MWGVASVLTRRGEWHEFKSWLVRESDCVINPPVLLRGRKYQQRNAGHFKICLCIPDGYSPDLINSNSLDLPAPPWINDDEMKNGPKNQLVHIENLSFFSWGF